VEQTDRQVQPGVESGYLASESFDTFVRQRAVSLIRFGYTLTGNQHDAADLVQESLIRMGAAWPRIRRKGDPEGYVRTTMARLHISWWRRRRRERLVGAVPELGYTDEGLNRLDAHGDLWQALCDLAPRQRAVLVLRYYEAHTDEEIATILGISRSAVRSTAFRGLQRLRDGWPPGPAPSAEPYTIRRPALTVRRTP
jgi:RNA polymerase sigma-70 factor (sigma-E family)